MLDGLIKLAWLELKIFLREPMGAIGSILFPVIIFVVLGRYLADKDSVGRFAQSGVPVLAVVSNCPQVNNPCNDGAPTPIRVVVHTAGG